MHCETGAIMDVYWTKANRESKEFLEEIGDGSQIDLDGKEWSVAYALQGALRLWSSQMKGR